jgi:hypothetical protein
MSAPGTAVDHLASVDQLEEKVQLQGYRFAAFAVCFYFAVPTLYYWAFLGYTPLDAFYVSAGRSGCWFLFPAFRTLLIHCLILPSCHH